MRDSPLASPKRLRAGATPASLPRFLELEELPQLIGGPVASNVGPKRNAQGGP
jgi:hypothetical protein